MDKYYPTEKEFPTEDIEEIIAKHELMASDAVLQLARACWAECKIRNEDSYKKERDHQVQLEESYAMHDRMGEIWKQIAYAQKNLDIMSERGNCNKQLSEAMGKLSAVANDIFSNWEKSK